MRLIKPDSDRRINLPGVPEPVPRPVDIESAQAGFQLLRTLRVYQFAQGTHIDGHAEEDEVYIAVLSGSIELMMRAHDGAESRHKLAAPESASEGAGACVAYLPVHGEYQLTASTEADVAYARATPRGARPVASFAIDKKPDASTGSPVLLDLRSHADRLRLQLLRISDRVRPSRMDLFGGGATKDGALLHVRSRNNGARLAVVADGRREKLHDWDTVAIGAGERAVLEGGFGTDVLGMLVWAE